MPKFNPNWIEINNQQWLDVQPDNGRITVYKRDSHGVVQEDETVYIQHGDFVTMLNWYSYQKRIGNKNLEF